MQNECMTNNDPTSESPMHGYPGLEALAREHQSAIDEGLRSEIMTKYPGLRFLGPSAELPDAQSGRLIHDVASQALVTQLEPAELAAAYEGYRCAYFISRLVLPTQPSLVPEIFYTRYHGLSPDRLAAQSGEYFCNSPVLRKFANEILPVIAQNQDPQRAGRLVMGLTFNYMDEQESQHAIETSVAGFGALLDGTDDVIGELR